MKLFRNNIFSITVAVLIVVFSFANPDNINRINILHLHNTDKMVHALMYFAFTITIIFEHRHKINRIIHYLYSGIIPLALGFTIEILQPVITKNRSGEMADIIFNLSGIILAVTVWFLVNLFREKS